jgi:hypothetical protein
MERRYRNTSISLRENSYRRFSAALKILDRNGITWSESEFLHRLAKVYLRHWRGRKQKAERTRRYNRCRGKKNVRVSWYMDMRLYLVLWARAIHSGESVSRMLDFAITYYLPRFLEECLRDGIPGHRRSQRNAPYWQARYERRHKPQPEIFVNYCCRTRKNDSRALIYRQKYRIFTKRELFDPTPNMNELINQ